MILPDIVIESARLPAINTLTARLAFSGTIISYNVIVAAGSSRLEEITSALTPLIGNLFRLLIYR